MTPVPGNTGYRRLGVAGQVITCCLPRPGVPRARRRCPSWAGSACPAGRSARPWSGPRSAGGPLHGRAWPARGRPCEPRGQLLLGLLDLLGLLAGGLLGLAGLLVYELAG